MWNFVSNLSNTYLTKTLNFLVNYSLNYQVTFLLHINRLIKEIKKLTSI